MADTTYATLAELKARSSVSGSNSDVILQQILNSAANVVDRWTRKPPLGAEAFSQSSGATRYFDDDLSMDGVVEIDDLLTITVLTRATSTLTSSDYNLYPYNVGTGPYTSIRLVASATTISLPLFGGLSYHYPYHNIGQKQIAVTGTWGYCTAANRPPEIKEATLRQALRMWEWQNISKADVLQMVVNPYKDLDPVVTQLLMPYRKVVWVE